MDDIINPDWAQTFETLEDIMWFLIIYLIFLVVMTIFLAIALSFFSKARHDRFGEVFLTSFIITIIFAITFIFLTGIVAWIIVLILTWLLISARHHTGFLGAIAVSVVAFLLYIIVALIIEALVGIAIFVWPF
ncbi:MAG: hypothetical protein ACQERB_12030 [Promethearchaeati archaeon]